MSRQDLQDLHMDLLLLLYLKHFTGKYRTWLADSHDRVQDLAGFPQESSELFLVVCEFNTLLTANSFEVHSYSSEESVQKWNSCSEILTEDFVFNYFLSVAFVN